MTKEKSKEYADYDYFSNIVQIIKEVMDEGIGNFQFDEYSAGFRITDKDFSKKYGITREKFSVALKEIMSIVINLLSNNKEYNLEVTKKENPEYVDDLTKKYDLIEKEIMNTNLYRKYYLETNYKTGLLEKFDWDIILKKNKEGILNNQYPIALLNVIIKTPCYEGSPIPRTESIIFEATITEVEKLINELNKIKEFLMKEEEGIR